MTDPTIEQHQETAELLNEAEGSVTAEARVGKELRDGKELEFIEILNPSRDVVLGNSIFYDRSADGTFRNTVKIYEDGYGVLNKRWVATRKHDKVTQSMAVQWFYRAHDKVADELPVFREVVIWGEGPHNPTTEPTYRQKDEWRWYFDLLKNNIVYPKISFRSRNHD